MDKEEEEIILHLLWWSKLKRGGHYFYLESRERVTEAYSQLLPLWLVDKMDLQFYVSLFQNSAKLLLHKMHTKEKKTSSYIIGLSDEYTSMAVMKKEISADLSFFS